MEMETNHSDSDNQIGQQTNGHGQMANYNEKENTFVEKMDSCSHNGFNGVNPGTKTSKRSLEEDDNNYKRQRVTDDQCKETADNNIVLSSYNSILAISALPLKQSAVLQNHIGNANRSDMNDNNGMETNRMEDETSHNNHHYLGKQDYMSQGDQKNGLNPVCHNAPTRCIGLSSHYI